ncbi:hypothetical protein WG899_02460 [Paucibacter sp. AS339]
MFNKILIAKRGARTEGAVVCKTTHCVENGEAGHAGDFTPGAAHV